MKIEELIIDGFKSYAARTVITGWDAQFNAITGLNGSGKSNILDAICFVLGISAMSTVRASSLQDLIYKRGQAGVTKASVTIVFDNSDKKTSPIGFKEHHKISITRQIVLGGTSKYLINGHRAQQQTVLQLFQSVQLNINNPNFLIMQGKITKVLNMPPSQILALIAEAAGTKLFEDRREKAVKTMAKKDTKLTEIKTLLLEEIEPKLEKLRKEKRAFLEFQQTQTELDKLLRVVSAHDYTNYSVKFQLYEQKLVLDRDHVTGLSDDIDRLTGELVALNEDLEKIRIQKEKELKKGGRLLELEKQEVALSKEIVRLGTSKSLKQESYEKETKVVADVAASQEKLGCELKQMQGKLSSSDQAESKTQLQQLRQEIAKKEELLTSLQTGIDAKGKTGGYLGQIQEIKDKISHSEVSIEQQKLKKQRIQQEMSKDEKKLEGARADSKKSAAEIEVLTKKYEESKSKLQDVGFDVEQLKQLKTQELQLKQQIYELNTKVDQLRRTVGSVEFQYNHSEFSPTSIKGVAAKLFSLDKENFDSATALEVSAGGKLFNVVVDNEKTASKLLERGQLRKRVTIIPLNKISSRVISQATTEFAKQLCPGKVELALNLIGYEPEVVRAMEYIFGSVFITKDPQTSKEITFNPKVKARSVTLDGDVYDPQGTLSGGSRKHTSSMLITLQNYNKLNSELGILNQQLAKLRQEINSQEAIGNQTQSLQKQASLNQHSLELAIRNNSNSVSNQMLTKYDNNMKEVHAIDDAINQEVALADELKQELMQSEKDMQEFDSNKGSKLKELQNDIKATKKKADSLDKSVSNKLQLFQELEFEVEKLVGDIEELKNQKEEASKNIEDYQNEINTISETLGSQTKQVELLLLEIDKEKANMIGINKEINDIELVINDKNKLLNSKKLTKQKLGHELEKIEASTIKLRKHLDALAEEHEWLLDDNIIKTILQQNPNVNIEESRSRVDYLANKFQGMKRKVNSNIMSMIDNVEKKENSLKTMITTIEKDKSKIEETIHTLDEYKRDTLVKTWQKVTKDFGNIFADLLPGAFAKLVIPENKDITEGLEVKVMLGKVWKESLVELSGGQRSLVALSLIMALLQFKPAPMYILDEVDAALDLSHTQNIGHLIKTRFKGSQFIVVSLKEGMFTNANSVFRTRFQDGTSVVSMM